MSELDLSYWLALGERARVCKGFEWKRGMHCWLSNGAGDAMVGDDWAGKPDIPDLRDAGTAGHLLAAARADWGDPRLTIVGSAPDRWMVNGVLRGEPRQFGPYTTKAEAIVSACEVAE